ncbi:MAG TPA: hypothetical protein VFU89_03580 [Rhabdochlamydiaceae bacterium]|nr:hypothetical protein [Rhabdochlamydiaceae bacterium]
MAAIENPILTLLSAQNDLLQYTFSFNDPTELLKNGRVCRLWRTLTLKAWDTSNYNNLFQFSQIKTMSAYINELNVIFAEFRYFPGKPPQQTPGKIPQQTPQKPPEQLSKTTRRKVHKKISQQTFITISQQIPEESPQQKTPEQIETPFWQAQGKILTLFKKLTSQERLAVKAQSPHLRLFDLENMSLTDAIQTKSFETFSILFSHSPPLSSDLTFGNSELDLAIAHASTLGHFRMIRVLIDSDAGSGSKMPVREANAAHFAWKNSHFTCVDALITKENQFNIAWQALQDSDATLFNYVQERLKAPFNDYEMRVLVAKGEKAHLQKVVEPFKKILPPIADWEFADELEKTLTDNELEKFKHLLASHSIKEIFRLRNVAQTALEKNKPGFAFLLLEKGYSSAIDIMEDFVCRRSLGLSWRLKAVKFICQHRLWSALSWICGITFLVLALAATCYYTSLELAKFFRALCDMPKAFREFTKSIRYHFSLIFESFLRLKPGP